LVSVQKQAAAEAEIGAFERWALEPSRLPRPLVPHETQVATSGGVRGRLTLVQPEAAVWNAWPVGARLFNDRMAHVFEVDLEAPGSLRWSPVQSTLELNRPDQVLVAAGSAEVLLADLSWFALQQERWVLEGDLVARTRAAGPFRAAYMHQKADGSLAGLVAFPALNRDGDMSLADLHIVAMRVRIQVYLDGQPHTLEWVLD
jgi:hypothetical protein